MSQLSSTPVHIVDGYSDNARTSVANTFLAAQTFNGDVRLNGNVGLFNTAPVAKTVVSDPSALTASGDAGILYTVTEQGLINSLKTDITNLHTKVAALIDALQALGAI
jgi:hypothetical protein